MENIENAVSSLLKCHTQYERVISMYFDSCELRVVYEFNEDKEFHSKHIDGYVIDHFIFKYGNVEVCYKEPKNKPNKIEGEG